MDCLSTDTRGTGTDASRPKSSQIGQAYAGPNLELTAAQITTFEQILKAGFRFITVERAERYLGMERGGFIALLDPADGQIKLFGQVGYLLGEGIGMLVERREGKCFVWHEHSLLATSDMLRDYERFKADLKEILEDQEARDKVHS